MQTLEEVLTRLGGRVEPKIHNERFNGEFEGLAFFTQYDNELIPLDQEDKDEALKMCIDYAEELGYSHIEVAAHIGNPKMRDPTADTLNLNLVDWDDKRRDKILGWLKEKDIKISSLANYDNMLHKDFETRARNQDHLMKVIDAASDLGVEYVGTFAGRNMDLTETQNMRLFEETFTGLVHYAKTKNVKLMFENCPMEGWDPGEERQIQSISWSPENWIDMFNIMEKHKLGDSLGLNLDPSHLTWEGIDPIETVYLLAEAGHADKIFQVHAKDIKVDRPLKMRFGNMGVHKKGTDWNREYDHKVPGTVPYIDGGVDGIPSAREYNESVYWRGFISALRDVGYKGVISFEHEDHGSFKTAKLDEQQTKLAESDPNIQRLENSKLRKEALGVAHDFLDKVMKETATTRYTPEFENYKITTAPAK